MNMYKWLILFLTVALSMVVLPASAEVHTREEVRQLYAALESRADESPYLMKPRVAPPYEAGALTERALQSALDYVNFLRRVAYIDNDVTLSNLYTLRAQHAAALLAINDELLHDAPIAPQMDADFYETAHDGAMSSNIASINWMENEILRTAIEYFVRDDGAGNLPQLGHRRWLLNPNMGQTGFGLANAESGMTYAAMYAHDLSGTCVEWEYIAWPSRGAFPAELMSGEIAWSVTLNPRLYDLEASDICVTIAEKAAGDAVLRYFRINEENYGAGPCVIFVPDLEKLGIEAYEQNQVFRVELTGLKTKDGADSFITYEVQMIALAPQDVASVELDMEELTLAPGDAASLRATVVPAWADDLTVTWMSSDRSVAVVGVCGNVTAVGEGNAQITATSVNGRTAVCTVTVRAETISADSASKKE